MKRAEPDGERSSVQIAVAVVRQGDRVLVGERPAGVVLAGYAEFPGGKIEAGETSAAAAERECWEEAALEIRAVQLLYECHHDYPHGRVQVTFWECEPRQPHAATAELRPPFRWVTKSELQTLIFPPANEPVLARLLQADSREADRASD
ncbi:MAG: (deoxy)nucleoside triphosphate pyrophosphohydrolase [Planctomycetota bacterium]